MNIMLLFLAVGLLAIAGIVGIVLLQIWLGVEPGWTKVPRNDDIYWICISPVSGGC